MSMSAVCERRPAEPAQVPIVRQKVVALAREAGADAEAISLIALAVSEAATNVVLHAYDPVDDGWLLVEADVHDEHLEVVVTLSLIHI